MNIVIDGVIFQMQAGRPMGISRLWRSLIPRLVAALPGHNVTLLKRQGTAQGIPGVREVEIPAWYGGSEALLKESDRILGNVCRQLDASVFLSTYFTSAAGIKNVLMVYDLIPELMGWNLSEPEWTAKQRTIRLAQEYVSISHSTWHDLTRLYDIPPGAVTVAHCGVESQFQPANLEAITRFKKAHGIEKPYFILVGSRTLYKNSLPFFKAFGSLTDRNSFEIFTCGGEQSLLAEEARLIPGCRHSSVRFLSDADLAVAYSGAAALVYPSRHEGFGLPVLEAMACGCPVITGHNSSLPEVGGEAVLYVNPDSSDEIAKALRRVMEPETRTILACAGVERSRLFTWEKMGEIVARIVCPSARAQVVKSSILKTIPDSHEPAKVASGDSEHEARRLVEEANTHYQRGDLAPACEFLKRAVCLSEDNADYRAALGSLYYQMERYDEAFNEFTNLIQRHPGNIGYLIKTAHTAVRVGRIDVFEMSLGRVLELEPENLAALKLLADLNLQNNRFPDAAKVYWRILRKTPNDINVLLPLGRCFFELGDFETAASVYEQILGQDAGNVLARENMEVARTRIQQASNVVANKEPKKTEPSGNSNPLWWINTGLSIRSIPEKTGVLEINGVQGSLIRGDIQYLFDKSRLLPPAARMVEIGSDAGLATIILSNGLLMGENHSARIFCVDTWGDSGDAGKDALFANFQANLAKAGVESMVEVVRKTGEEASKQFANASLDMIFLNGEPLAGGILEELQTWLPKLKPGGFFVGRNHFPNGALSREVRLFAGQMGLVIKSGEPASEHQMFELLREVRPSGQDAKTAISSGEKTAPSDATDSISDVVGKLRSSLPFEPLVTAIVSCYNSEKYLRGCLEDLEAQTIADKLEIVVVDSHSPQNERAIVEEFQTMYRNIVYIRTEERETVYGAWNRAVSQARGKYLTNANTDDRHRHDAFEILARTLDENSNVSLVYADCLITKTENETFETAHPTGMFNWLDFNVADLVTKGCFVGPQPMWRKTVHAEHGLFDKEFFTAGDYEFWLRLAQNHNFLHVKQTLGLYLESPASVEHTNQERAAKETAEAHRRYKDKIVKRLSAETNSAGLKQLQQQNESAFPATGFVGRLKKAYELFGQSKFPEAWRSALEALKVRPFHPEAYVMMGETALAAGDAPLASKCAQRALNMAPKYDLALNLKKLLVGRKKGARSMQWPALPPYQPDKPRLSICLIAKNEEAFLGKCLASIKPIAHQIIVVDTGSTDRTVAIAREYGAEVYHFTWNDNFSDARNASLEHATGDWILVLDADEELPEKEHAELIKAMSNPAVIGYRLAITHVGFEGQGADHVPRLFRNAPGLHFAGRVHEQVFHTVVLKCETWGLKIDFCEALLVHHGYEANLMKSRQKVERNLQLLEQAVEEMPGEPNILLNLGLELSRSGRSAEGLARYQQAFEIMSGMPPASVVPELCEGLLTQYTSHLIKARRFNDAVQVLHSPLAARLGLTATMYYILGVCLGNLQRHEDAVVALKECLKKRNDRALTIILKEIKTESPYICLAASLMMLDRTDEAEAVYQKALQEFPNSRAARREYAGFQVHKKQPVEALKILHALVVEKADDAQAWEQGGKVVLSDPDFMEAAMDWTDSAIRNCPDHGPLVAQRAECLMLAQDAAGALPLWTANSLANNPRNQAGGLLCGIVTGDLTSAAGALHPSDEASVSREFLEHYRKLVRFGTERTIRTINEGIEEWKPLLPSAAQFLKRMMAEVRNSN